MLKVSRGALISEVVPGDPADKAGLKDGDIITKVEGTEIKDNRHLQLTVSHLKPGTEATVEYVRDGKTLAEKNWPAPTGAPLFRAFTYETTAEGGLLEDVASLSARITLKVHDVTREPDLARGMGVTQVPTMVLSGAAKGGVRQLTRGMAVELAVREWARRDPLAAAVVKEVDAKRLDCAARLFAACGVAQAEAVSRSMLLYAYVFGQSLMMYDGYAGDPSEFKAWIADRIAR